MKKSAAAIISAGLLLAAEGALGQTVVAVVESLNATRVNVQFMDYVTTGTVIRLDPRDWIVLGYLKSCIREKITGGTVIVGVAQSEVQRGKVDRIRVHCDGGGIQLLDEQQSDSAGLVSRSVELTGQGAAHEPQITLYGSSPIVEMRKSGVLVIERVDQPDEYHQVMVRKQDLLRGLFYDFAKHDKTLIAGGTYRVTLGVRQILFKIDPSAKPGYTPVISRLLRIQPAS